MQPFVIDTTQVLCDLLHKKVVKLCRVEFPDSDAVSKYIQDAYVGGLCNSLPNLANGLLLCFSGKEPSHSLVLREFEII